MRLAIQNKITDLCAAGTFPQVSYTSGTRTAVSSDSSFETPRIVVNEVSGTPARGASYGSRDGNYGMSNWNFEARLKFNSEVDTYQFLTEELKSVSFIQDNTRVRITSIGVPVVHPPRQDSHNGTEMVITFSVSTRR